MRAPVLMLALASAAGAAVLARPVQPPAGSPPTFRADTHLVEVSVTVHDKTGQPVSGLTRDDFTLLDEGREQPIDVFSVDGAARASGTTAAAMPTGFSSADFTNQLGPGANRGVTVILFDRVNTRLEDQRPARAQIAAFLQQIRPDDRVALYSLGADRTRVLHDFTNDGAALLRSLSWRAGADRPPDDPDLAAWISDTTKELSAMMLQKRVSITLDALVAIAHHLTGVRGRKNLIWVSSGVPWTIRDETLAVPVGRAARAIDDANVSIYPVDARGLVRNNGVTPAETMPEVAAMKGKITSAPVIPARGVAQSVPNLDMFSALASATGGRAFFNSNDITTAIRSAIDDGRVTYVLGYYPSHGKWDGAFRRITVTVKRPNVDVRHRSGYRAFPIAPKAPARTNQDLLDESASPLMATGIGLMARVVPNAPSAGPHDVALSIHVDPAAVSIWRDGDDWTVALELAITQIAADGRAVKGVVGSVEVGVPAARYEQVTTQGFTFSRTVTVADTADQIHLTLRDPASGATGSIMISLARLPVR